MSCTYNSASKHVANKCTNSIFSLLKTVTSMSLSSNLRPTNLQRLLRYTHTHTHTQPRLTAFNCQTLNHHRTAMHMYVDHWLIHGLTAIYQKPVSNTYWFCTATVIRERASLLCDTCCAPFVCFVFPTVYFAFDRLYPHFGFFPLLPEKLTVPQLVTSFPHFMKSESSSPHSQQPATCSCPQPDVCVCVCVCIKNYHKCCICWG
jgi:hypothetical protein